MGFPTTTTEQKGWRGAMRVFLASVLSVSILTSPALPVFAQAPATTATDVAAATTATTATVESVKKGTGDIFIEAAVVSLVSGVNYFTSQMAYSFAVALTSECPGQKVCWDSKPLKEGLTQAWQGAIGESIGSLSKELGLEKYGLNLCSPSLPSFTLQIQLGLLDEIKPPPPKCDLKNIIKNYSSLKNELSSGEFLNKMRPTFEPGQAPLSASLGIMNGLLSEKQEVEKNAAMKRMNDAMAGGFSGLADAVSGRVTAPAEVTRQEYNEYLKTKSKPADDSTRISAGQVASRAALSVVVNTAQTFAQTLIARLWNRFAQGLLKTEELVASQPDLVFNPEAILNPGTADIAAAIAPRFVNNAAKPREIGLVDILLVLSACPTESREPMNCAMDAQLSQAAREADTNPLTVREALKKNLLHGDWKLYGPDDKVNNLDPFCYTRAYCYANLTKMRAARVIPVGWEHAAIVSDGNRTLKDAVEGFDRCGQGNTEASPFCGLIDPNWVIKAPPTQCLASTIGSRLISPDISSRAEQCVDYRSCIKQDDAGNCIGGYGHCTMEKKIWRFNGEQCPAQYASCRSYTDPAGDEKQFTANTIDYGVCNAGNAGCKEYSLRRNVVRCTMVNGGSCTNPNGCECINDAKGGRCTVLLNANSCASVAGESADLRDDWDANDGTDAWDIDGGASRKIAYNDVDQDGNAFPSFAYFNGQVTKCDPANDGCQTLFPLAGGRSLNLVRNGGFEEQEALSSSGTSFHPQWWAPYSQAGSSAHGYRSDDGSHAASGVAGLRMSSTGETVFQDGIAVQKNRTYTLSARLIPDSGAVSKAVDMRFDLLFRDTQGQWLTVPRSAVAFTTGSEGFTTAVSPTVADHNPSASGKPNGIRVSVNGNVSGTSGRVWATFSTSSQNIGGLQLGLSNNGTTVTYIDDVQLESGGSPTAFHEGYGGEIRAVNAKLPRPEYGCSGSDYDLEVCGQYAQVCMEREVGCESYTPRNGDPTVPGIITAEDRCPAECVGYDTFKKEASTFDAEGPLQYFIPATARSCNAQDVGCSQFTDIENEQVSYYSNLRACVTADDGSVGTYYSWEGSDTSGYQLKLWNLKKSSGVALMDGVSDLCADATACTDTIAPCTKIDGQSGACNSAVKSQTTQRRGGFCTRADIDAGDFDCREFYDSSGNRHYRKLSKTIIASDTCRQYRITTSTEDDCDESNGRWDAAASRCVYFADLTQSRSCTAAVNGCRAYKGNAATNVKTVFTQDFEGDALDTAIWTGAHAISPESVVVGGHSVKVEGSALALEVRKIVQPKRSYALSFWARGSGELTIPLDKATGAPGNATVTKNPTDLWKTPLTSNWQRYEFGPVFISTSDTGPAWGTFNVKLAFTQTVGVAYIDNIVLKEVQDGVSLVRGSWKTPASCDKTASGIASPQEMLGCREYRTRTGGTEFLRSFSSLCREKAIGCAAYSRTENTPNDPYATTTAAVCSGSSTIGTSACDYTLPDGGKLADVCTIPVGANSCRFDLAGWSDAYMHSSVTDQGIVPPDSIGYYAIRPQDICPSSQASCKVVATPVYEYESDGTPKVKEWTEGAFLHDPTKLGALMCRTEAVGCQAFVSKKGAEYFKDPQGRLCEYREGVRPVKADTNGNGVLETLDDKEYRGWFMVGDDENSACPGARVTNDGELVIQRNGDAGYDQWTGTCSAQYAGCEEFVDPQDTSVQADDAVICTRTTACASDNGCACNNPSGRFMCTVVRGDTTCASGGKSYYYIDDQRLDAASCKGQVSLRQGCVLFDQTSDPFKRYVSALTYSDAEKREDGALVPVRISTTPGTNDTNRILKVRMDRECTEWLTCTGYDLAFDVAKSQYVKRCLSGNLSYCRKADGGTADFYSCADSRSPSANPPPLDKATYNGRNRTWFGEDYSGYSVPNAYPAATATVYANTSGSDFFSAYRFGALLNPSDSCTDDDPCLSRNGNSGVCKEGRCIYPMWGQTAYVSKEIDGKPRCRAFPEQDSPFDAGAVDSNAGVGAYKNGVAISKKAAYASANVCLDGGTGCYCSYKRATYGGTTLYHSAATTEVRPKICTSVSSDGEESKRLYKECGNDSECGEGGKCQQKTEFGTQNGWAGVCLDYDRSSFIDGKEEYGCLLWLPFDQISGAPDSSSQFEDAGYKYDGQDDLLYCQVGEGTQEDNGYDFTIHDDYNKDLPRESKPLAPEDEADDNGSLRHYPLDKLTNGDGRSISKRDIAGIIIENQDGLKGQFVPNDTVDWVFHTDKNDGGGGSASLNADPANSLPIDTPGNIQNGRYSRCENTFNVNLKGTANDSGPGGKCNISDGADKSGTCLIMWPTFDSADKLTGFDTIFCYDDEGSRTGLKLKLQLREWCAEIAEVGDAGTVLTAWTDTLRRKSSYHGIAYAHSSSRPVGEEPTGSQEPYSRIRKNYVEVHSPSELKFKDVSGSSAEPPSIWERILPIYGSEGGSNYTWAAKSGDKWITNTGSTASGVPFACKGDCGYGGVTDAVEWNSEGSGARAAGEKNLSKLFAVATRVYRLGSGTTYNDVDDNGWDHRLDLVKDGSADNAPTIRAVNAADCATDNLGLCEETSNEGLTVGTRSSGDILSPTKGRFTTSVRFYAYADKNHMPIRRKIVDFGDNSVSRLSGYFKNHRGCPTETARCDSKNLICGGDEWGKHTDSCESQYFQDIHTYTCSASIWSGLNSCDSSNPSYPCKRDDNCVFKPRVQILDNWGLCNGECPGGADGKDICFNSDRFPNHLNNEEFDPAPGDECHDLRAGEDGSGGSKYAPRFTGGRVQKAWTEYDGVIKVPKL